MAACVFKACDIIKSIKQAALKKVSEQYVISFGK